MTRDSAQPKSGDPCRIDISVSAGPCDASPGRTGHQPFFNLEFGTALSQKAQHVFYDTLISFAEVLDAAQRLAGICSIGAASVLATGCCCSMQNSRNSSSALAILRANAVVVPLNPMYLTGEFQRCAIDAGATTVIVSQDLYPRSSH